MLTVAGDEECVVGGDVWDQSRETYPCGLGGVGGGVDAWDGAGRVGGGEVGELDLYAALTLAVPLLGVL